MSGRSSALKESKQVLKGHGFTGKSLYLAVANTVQMDTATAQQDTSESTTHFRAITEFVKTLRKTKPGGLEWRSMFYPEENLLIVQESWSAFPMKFNTIDDNDFYCFQKDFPIHFEFNTDGEVSAALIAYNIDVWEKVK